MSNFKQRREVQRANSGREAIWYPFPLQGGFIAEITLPRDLTADECERLCQLLMAVVKTGEKT